MIENAVLCGECSEVLGTVPEKSVDLILTSPPYTGIRSYKGFTFPFEKIAPQLIRVLKDRGVLVWVVADETINGNESGESFRQALRFKELGLVLHDTMIWAKGLPMPGEYLHRYWPAFEYMFVFCKGTPPRTFHPLAEESVSGGKSTKIKGFKRTDGRDQNTIKKPIRSKLLKRLKNVWVIWPDNFSGHPARFPTELASRHIYSWSNPDDLVLDPCCGSGTTLFAAKRLGRRYLGIDISKEYCELSRINIERYGG